MPGKCSQCSKAFYSAAPTTSGECIVCGQPSCIACPNSPSICELCGLWHFLNVTSKTCSACGSNCYFCIDSISCIFC